MHTSMKGRISVRNQGRQITVDYKGPLNPNGAPEITSMSDTPSGTRFAANVTCYGVVNFGDHQQEHYESASGDARKRANELRALGYKVTAAPMGPQVTSVGTVNMTMLNVSWEDGKDAPPAPAKVERLAAKNLAKLTPAEESAWNKAFSMYVEEGIPDDQADKLAWDDLVEEFPRLKAFDGALSQPPSAQRLAVRDDPLPGKWLVTSFNYWAIVKASSKEEAIRKFKDKFGEPPTGIKEARPAKVSDYSRGAGEEIP